MILEYFEGPYYELSQYSAYVKGLLIECQLEEAEYSVFNNTLSYFQLNKHRDVLYILARIFKGYGNWN